MGRPSKEQILENAENFIEEQMEAILPPFFDNNQVWLTFQRPNDPGEYRIDKDTEGAGSHIVWAEVKFTPEAYEAIGQKGVDEVFRGFIENANGANWQRPEVSMQDDECIHFQITAITNLKYR